MSRIEQLISEIEEYIDSCKFQPLSNTKILVNKEEIEELLVAVSYTHLIIYFKFWWRPIYAVGCRTFISRPSRRPAAS